jgi:3-carboxy-cis,cis-muconate cycloisomerase
MPARLIDCLATDDEFSEIFSDDAVLGEMLRFEVALARSQSRLGLIPEAAAEAIARCAEGLDAAPISREARQSATVVIPFVKALTAKVEAADPASAGCVHLGATSQDVIDSALVLCLRRARDHMAAHHVQLSASLRGLAEQHADTVMLTRTLLQPAPPTTFGYKAASWQASVERSWESLTHAFDEAIQLQFGGASGTLASYGIDGLALSETLAKELELPLPAAPWHSHRDRLAALVAACGVFTGTLAKIARDISLLMQPEIGELSEFGGGSSAMPNKRNPAGSTLVLAAAVRVPGLVASFLSGMVQENERAAGGWQAEWPTVSDVVQSTGSALATMRRVAISLNVDTARMRDNIDATGESVFAERAAMLLARSMGRTKAQDKVAEMLKAGALREVTPDIAEPEAYLGSAEQFRRRLLGLM